MIVLMILCLGLVIILAEMFRIKKLLYMDFMRIVSVVFFVIFVSVPLILYTLGPLSSPRFFWFSVVDYSDEYFASIALLIVAVGYFSILAGFVLGIRSRSVRGLAQKVAIYMPKLSRNSLLLMALFVELVSTIFLIAYVIRRGGNLLLLLQYPGQIRVGLLPAGIEESSFTFLTYATLGLFSTFILISLPQKTRWINSLVLFSIIKSFLILYLKAGRLHLANFLLVLFVASFGRKSRTVKFIGFLMWLASFFSILFVGKYLLKVTSVLDLPSEPLEYLQLFASELAFPYLSLVYTLVTQSEFRFFVDALLAFLYVFINPFSVIFVGSPLDLGLSVARINTLNILGTTYMGEIPVDIVTLGYFNGGVAGVLITCFLFGMVLAWFETALPARADGVVKTVRWAFMIFLATVGTVYADPVNVLRDGLYLIVPFISIFVLMSLKPKRAYRRASITIHRVEL